MRWNLVIWVMLLLATMVVIAGCTTQQATTTMTTSQPTATAQATTTSTQPCFRATISSATLINYLPTAPADTGWSAGETGGYTQSTGQGCDYSTATRTFNIRPRTGPELTMGIILVDTNNWNGLGMLSFYGQSYTSSTDYSKSVTVNGYPAYEVATTGQDIRVIVNIGNGIWVAGTLQGSSNTTDIYPFMNAINYAGLDGLV